MLCFPFVVHDPRWRSSISETGQSFASETISVTRRLRIGCALVGRLTSSSTTLTSPSTKAGHSRMMRYKGAYLGPRQVAPHGAAGCGDRGDQRDGGIRTPESCGQRGTPLTAGGPPSTLATGETKARPEAGTSSSTVKSLLLDCR